MRHAFPHWLADPIIPGSTGLASRGQEVRTQRTFAQALAWVVSRALQGRVSYEMGVPTVWPYLRYAPSRESLQSGPTSGKPLTARRQPLAMLPTLLTTTYHGRV